MCDSHWLETVWSVLMYNVCQELLTHIDLKVNGLQHNLKKQYNMVSVDLFSTSW